MRACVQRVSAAHVAIDGQVVAAIDHGVAVLLGVGREDDSKDVQYMADKITGLRIFADSDGKMNCTLGETNGEMLVVSQFTLYGDTRKGRRPSFINAADPDTGNRLYEEFVQRVRDAKITVATGVFQANMQVSLVNDGPVTILIDSKKSF